MNLEANTELEFMSKIKLKNPDYSPHEKLLPQPQKKVRKTGTENLEEIANNETKEEPNHE